MIQEFQTQDFVMDGKRVRCNWSDNIIIPNVSHFKETSENLSKILNPDGKSIQQKKSEQILKEIFGDKK